MHTAADQSLLKCIAAHPVLFMLTLETAKSRGVSGALVAGRHLRSKSALLSLNLYPLAAPQESVKGRQKAQLYTSIPLMPLVIEKSEVTLQKKFKNHPEGPLVALP